MICFSSSGTMETSRTFPNFLKYLPSFLSSLWFLAFNQFGQFRSAWTLGNLWTTHYFNYIITFLTFRQKLKKKWQNSRIPNRGLRGQESVLVSRASRLPRLLMQLPLTPQVNSWWCKKFEATTVIENKTSISLTNTTKMAPLKQLIILTKNFVILQ